MSGHKKIEKLTTEICMECGAKCCRNIAVEIEAPTTREYKEYIRWYLAHQNISVFVEEGSWFLEFHTDCRMRMPDNSCAVYERRPRMCRDYGYDEDGDINCFISDFPFNYEYEFKSLEEFDKYLDEEQRKKRGKKKLVLSGQK